MGQTEGRAGLEGAVGSWVLEVLEVVLCWRCPLDIQRGYQVGCGIKKKKVCGSGRRIRLETRSPQYKLIRETVFSI